MDARMGWCDEARVMKKRLAAKCWNRVFAVIWVILCYIWTPSNDVRHASVSLVPAIFWVKWKKPTHSQWRTRATPYGKGVELQERRSSQTSVRTITAICLQAVAIAGTTEEHASLHIVQSTKHTWATSQCWWNLIGSRQSLMVYCSWWCQQYCTL